MNDFLEASESFPEEVVSTLDRELRRAKKKIGRLPAYEKMLASYQAMLFAGEYEALRPSTQPFPLFMLDNVNFSSAVVEDPLPMRELISIFEIEPGYHTITGDCEAGGILRELEYARALRYARAFGLEDAGRLRRVVDGTVGIVTAGATGAVNAVLTAALHRSRTLSETKRREIVFNTPCYCLPEGFACIHGLVRRPVEGTQENHFLPSLDSIMEAVGPGTLACFLTYPSNPSLGSWTSSDLPALRRLVERCQELGVLLVADTVFQDLQWGAEPVPEIFALAERPTLLAKVHSPSKDRPFACGYRVGYVVADAALEPWLHQTEALAKNSSNTMSLVWLGFDCLFRHALLAGGLRREDFEMLAGKYLFGYGAPNLSAAEMYDRVVSSGMFDRYAERLAAFRCTIRSHLEEIHAWLTKSACFEPRPIPPFGNLLMFRVRPPYDRGGEDDFFFDTLRATNVTSTVGGCFGMSREQGVWIRLAVGGAPVDVILPALHRLESYLQKRDRTMDNTTGETVAVDPVCRAGADAAISMIDPSPYPAAHRLLSIEPGPESLRLFWDDGEVSTLHYIWLRDNCACPVCRHPEAMERTFDILTVPLDIRAEEASITEGGALRIVWPGDSRHVSFFAPGWLRAHGYSRLEKPGTARPLWGPELERRLPSLSYREVMQTDAGLEAWCRFLLDYGVARIDGVPTEPGEVARVAGRIGCVWSHYFGNVFNVKVLAKTDSSAYSALALPPHTDLPSRSKQPAFQFLHCLENSVTGGDFILLHSFQIAERLRREHPDFYETLSTVPVEFRFVSPTVDYRFKGLVIEHDADGELCAVRFNSFLQSPLRVPYDRMIPFYRAYRAFLELVSDPRNQIRLRFRPGDLMSFDNCRVLHARTSYDPSSGLRHLQGCYLDRDEIYSRMQVLARRVGKDDEERHGF